MARRLDIGIASYGNPEALYKTLQSVLTNSTTDWRMIIINNPHPEELVQWQCERVLDNFRDRAQVITPASNIGYASAVKEIQKTAKTEYIAYLDNDIEIYTRGWDEVLCSYLDRFHEIGMVFPNGGAYSINRGSYTEIMWGVGFAWVLNRLCMSEVGLFDDKIGHQNEADYAMRVRMAGWKCASAPEVRIAHHATATNDPASTERIAKGVREFVDKWTRYFGGKNLNYHSPNVLRWEDWPPQALYLEEWWKSKLPTLNANPEVVTIERRDYDLIKVPRFRDFYRGRII